MSPSDPTRAATNAVARYVVGARLDDAPAHATQLATEVIADTIATTIAGSASDLAPVLGEYLRRNPAPGPAPVVGLPGGFGIETAALANGTLAHALDFDDVVTLYTGHPSVVVVPALIAAATYEPTGGHDFIEAYVVGMEAGGQIARGIGLGHYRQGWHATSTLCLFAGVGAVAKLRRLSVEEIETAIGIASSLSAGLQRNFGTMTKPFHAGWAARSAVAACELASLGWTANREMLETDRGFYAVYGDPGSDPARVAPHLGSPHMFADPGIALKKYPCCWASHRAIDAVLSMLEGRASEDVAEVECHAPPAVFDQLQYHRPKTGLEAKFSGEYVIAAAVLDRRIVFSSFKDGEVQRPEIAAFYDRISFVEDERCAVGEGSQGDEAPGQVGFLETTVRFRDGSSDSRLVRAPIGSPANPMSWDDIREKFLDCCAYGAMAPAAATELVDRLEKLSDVADVAALLGGIALPGSAFAQAFSR